MTDKLRECPFCGGDKLKIDYKSRNGVESYSVRCNKCHARGGTASVDIYSVVDTEGYAGIKRNRELVKKKVIELWNTRKPMDRIVEQLEKATEGVKEKANTLPEIESAGFLCGWLALKAAIKIVKGVQNE